MDNEKIIELKGGLGNQLFQYAMYLKLKSMGYSVFIDDREILRHGNQHNGLDLTNAFDIHYSRMSLCHAIKCLIWRTHDKIIKKGNLFKAYNILIDEEPSTFADIINESTHYLKGYWQEPNYWFDIRDDIVSLLRFRVNPINELTKKLVERMQKVVTVSIHVRRGDYLWNGNAESRMGICTLEYYKEAISYIKEFEPTAYFLVFSDDPDWVKNNFDFIDYVMVDWNKGKNSYVDMFLMSRCNHNIIANSSFSWWGAFLNKNPDKMIICPRKWYNDMDSNLMLDEWIKI